MYLINFIFGALNWIGRIWSNIRNILLHLLIFQFNNKNNDIDNLINKKGIDQ